MRGRHRIFTVSFDVQHREQLCRSVSSIHKLADGREETGQTLHIWVRRSNRHLGSACAVIDAVDLGSCTGSLIILSYYGPCVDLRAGATSRGDTFWDTGSGIHLYGNRRITTTYISLPPKPARLGKTKCSLLPADHVFCIRFAILKFLASSCVRAGFPPRKKFPANHSPPARAAGAILSRKVLIVVSPFLSFDIELDDGW